MKLVMALVVREDAELLDAHVAFHLNAGVDFVLAADDGSDEAVGTVLEAYAREGYLQRDPAQDADDAAWENRMAQVAVSDHGADWLIVSRPDEFWWPRGESLKDVLVSIPPRYSIVQALVRPFVPRPDGASFFAERMVVRRQPAPTDDPQSERLASLLRPIFRASPALTIRSGEQTALSGYTPLRAWYPIEVLHFPERSSELVVDDEELASGVADGSLVVDERLRDALRALRRESAGDGGPARFLLPTEAEGRKTFRIPDIVDDAAYAVDCAAVGEVDLARLDRHIRELEDRIAWLEERFWPRVMRTLSRLVHRFR